MIAVIGSICGLLLIGLEFIPGGAGRGGRDPATRPQYAPHQA
jgi:hypothetical protein